MDELTDVIVSNYNNWVISFMKFVSIKVIITGCKEFKNESDIKKEIYAQGNKCLRYIAKFKEYMSEQSYKSCVDFTTQMCDDTLHTIIKTFYNEGVY